MQKVPIRIQYPDGEIDNFSVSREIVKTIVLAIFKDEDVLSIEVQDPTSKTFYIVDNEDTIMSSNKYEIWCDDNDCVLELN